MLFLLMLLASSAFAHDSTEYDLCIDDAKWENFARMEDTTNDVIISFDAENFQVAGAWTNCQVNFVRNPDPIFFSEEVCGGFYEDDDNYI